MQRKWPITLPTGPFAVLKFLSKADPGYDRQHKLNVYAVEKHGTIEFRHPRASTCIDEVGAYIGSNY
jgi:hypothetical protein